MRFPNESGDYRTARDALLEQEKRLRAAIEDVAAARRALPPGGEVPHDYRFTECDDAGMRREVALSDLFGAHDTLVVYSYMFGPDADPCPMCTPLLDGLDGVEDHLRQRLSLVVVAESPAERLWDWRRRRGWQRLRLVSSAGNDYNADYHGLVDGSSTTMLNVFHRDGSVMRHFWGTEMAHDTDTTDAIHHRGLDLVNPVWGMFDVTPQGRGDWITSIAYGPEVVGTSSAGG